MIRESDIPNTPDAVIESFLNFDNNLHEANNGVATPKFNHKDRIYPIPTREQAKRLIGSNIMESWINSSGGDLSERIALHLGDDPFEPMNCNPKIIETTKKAINRIQDTPNAGSIVYVNSRSLPVINTGDVGYPDRQSINSISEVTFPPNHVILHEDLIENIRTGFSKLGIEVGNKEIKKLSPKQIGLAILFAINAEVEFATTSNNELIIHARADTKIPPELAFRHIGPGMRVINAALIPYLLLKEKTAKLPISLPINDHERMAQSLISGEFNQALITYPHQGITEADVQAYEKAIKANLNTKSIEILAQSQALESLRQLVERKQVADSSEPRRRARDAELDIQIENLSHEISNYHLRALEGEPWFETLSREGVKKLPLQKQLDQLQLEKEFNSPMNVQMEILHMILPLFEPGQDELVRKVLTSPKPRDIEGSFQIIAKIQSMFGNLAPEVIYACTIPSMMPNLGQVESEIENNNSRFEKAEENSQIIHRLEPKVNSIQDIKLLLELLK